MAAMVEQRGEGAYLSILIGGALLCIGLVGVVNFAVDPLQIHRRASYTAIYSENQRHQNAGLVRTHDYETIVVGTSHVENLSPRFIEQRLGGRAIKLAVEGSRAVEQAAIVEAAIETGRVRRVIWGLDHLAFRDSPLSPWGEDALPRHLYHPGIATIGRYLLSLDTLLLSRDALLGRGHRDLETLNRWAETSQFGPRRVEASWQRIRRWVAREKLRPGEDFSRTAARTRQKVERFIGPLVRANPEVEFDLFFAPYSIVAYVADHLVSPHEFSERLAFKRGVVEAFGAAPNVRIHDLQTQQVITHDLSRYKDLHHFDAGVSDGIVRAIAADIGRVDPATYERRLEEHAAQVERFMRRACRDPALRAYCVGRVERAP